MLPKIPKIALSITSGTMGPTEEGFWSMEVIELTWV